MIYGVGGRGVLLLAQMVEMDNGIAAMCAYLGNESAETITEATHEAGGTTAPGGPGEALLIRPASSGGLWP